MLDFKLLSSVGIIKIGFTVFVVISFTRKKEIPFMELIFQEHLESPLGLTRNTTSQYPTRIPHIFYVPQCLDTSSESGEV